MNGFSRRLVLMERQKEMHLSMSNPGGGGGGEGNLREFDCGVYPTGGDFDRT